jgi:hypothetical protein
VKAFRNGPIMKAAARNLSGLRRDCSTHEATPARLRNRDDRVICAKGFAYGWNFRLRRSPDHQIVKGLRLLADPRSSNSCLSCSKVVGELAEPIINVHEFAIQPASMRLLRANRR